MPISLINEGRLTFRRKSCRNFSLNIVVLFSIQCILHSHAHFLDFHRASGNNDRILFHLLLCHFDCLGGYEFYVCVWMAFGGGGWFVKFWHEYQVGSLS